MTTVSKNKGTLKVNAYVGDTKTLLAQRCPRRPGQALREGQLVDGLHARSHAKPSFCPPFRPEGADPAAKVRPDFRYLRRGRQEPRGEPYTYDQEYEWLRFIAQDRLFEILDEAIEDKSLHLDVFAYDLSEPKYLGSTRFNLEPTVTLG